MPFGRQGWRPGWPTPAGSRNLTSMVEKEPELVWEVGQYQLDIVGLASMHSTGFGTKLLLEGLDCLG